MTCDATLWGRYGAHALAQIGEALLWAEQQIALLERCRPVAPERERQALLAAAASGRLRAPRWSFAPPPRWDEVARVLDGLEALGDELSWGPQLRARVAELRLERELVDARGSRRLPELAVLRYPVDEAALGRADLLATAWLREGPRRDAAGSGDASATQGEAMVVGVELAGAFRSALTARGWSARVVECDDLASVAAVGWGTVFVRAGARAPRAVVERLVVHELEGHLGPRLRAETETLPLFRAGTLGSGEDEEGRALLLEQRLGALAPGAEEGRRYQLALRHRAAAACRAGADFVEVWRDAQDQGAPLEEALRLAERVFRGGGLAREIVYLPALERVSAALAARPALERWLERGRLSIEAARQLEALLGELGALR